MWYVEPDCCLLCGVPMAEAPDNFAWALDPVTGEPTHCYVSRQPANASEEAQMQAAARNSEVGCIRRRVPSLTPGALRAPGAPSGH